MSFKCLQDPYTVLTSYRDREMLARIKLVDGDAVSLSTSKPMLIYSSQNPGVGKWQHL